MRGRSTGQSWQIRRVIAENKELKRRVEIVVDSPRDHDTTSPTLEADDSKTDTSLIEVTPLAAKVKGRPQHVGGEREVSCHPTYKFSNCVTQVHRAQPK